MTERRKEKDGHPVQIIDIQMNPKGPSRMDLSSNLKHILKDIADKDVALISIAGPSRQGKSFLLSYMIKYLTALEKKSSKWIKKSSISKPLDGFPFQNGIERQTTGLWLWSRPFMIRNHKDEEIAVLVMDTQGVFDNHTTNREWSAIVGLSLLTSSCLIYNVVHNLQEDVLQILETFMQYGMLAMKDDETGEKCFQKLTFLIRDWNMPDECEYGPLGGQEFLDRKMKIESHLPEPSKRARETLKKCFEELSCFLMPDPGEEAKSNDFTGSLSELDKRFVSCLSSFMETVMSPDQIKVKRVGGQLMKGKNVQQLFQRYIDIFNSDEMPTSVNLLDATAHAVCENMSTKCKDGFISRFQAQFEIYGFLNDAEFNTATQTLTKEFLLEFDRKKKFGDGKIARKHRRRLEGDFLKLTDKMKARNMALKTEKSDHEQNVILSDFKSKISQLLQTNFILHEDLDSIFKQETETMLAAFCQRFDNDKTILGEIIPIFNEKIHEIVNQFHGDNDDRISKAQTAGKTIVNNCFTTYETEMSLRLLQTPSAILNNEVILTVDTILRNQAMGTFDANFKMGNDKLVAQFKSELESLLNGKLEEIAKNNSQKKNDQISRTEELIRNITDLYENDISMALAQDTSPDKTFLQHQHFHLLQKYTDLFMTQSGIQDLNVLQPFIQKLKSSLNESLQKAEMQLIDLQNKLRDDIGEQIEQVKLDYQTEMVEIMNAANICSENQLNSFHQNSLKRGDAKLQFPKFLSSQEKQDLRNRLAEELNQEFEALNLAYLNKLDEASFTAKNHISDAVLDYNTKMENTIDNFALESELETEHFKVVKQIEDNYSKQVSFLPSEVLSQHKRDLADELEQAFTTILDKFATKKFVIEEQIESLYDQAIRKYNDEMEETLAKVQEEDILTKYHDLYKKQSVTQFTLDVASFKIDSKKMVAKLGNHVTTIFQDLLSKNSATVQENLASVNSLVNECVDMYKQNIKELLESETCENELQFLQQEKPIRKTTINYFQQNGMGISLDIFTEKKEDLKCRIDIEYHSYLENFKRKKIDEDAFFKKFNAAAMAEYTNLMNSFVQNNPAINLTDLASTHEDYIAKVLQDLPPRCSKDIHKGIKAQLERMYKDYKDQVATNISLAEKTLEITNTLKKDIAKEMKKFSATSLDVTALKPLEDRLDGICLDKLNSCDIPDEKKKQELIVELRQHIKVESKVAEKVVENKEPDSNAMKMAKHSAMLTYEEEMERHFGNSDFIHPRVLDSYHRQASKVALRKAEKGINITPKALNELNTLFDAAFSKHQDKNRMNIPVKPAIGIDLGTTFSCVGVYHNGKVTIIPNENSKNTTPSYVAFSNGIEIIGEPAKSQAHMNPENTIFDAKRLIGRKFNDAVVQADIKQWPFKVVEGVKGVPKIEVDGKTYHPEEISAKVLKRMKEIAEKYLNCTVENAVITVPAYFNDGQKQATRDAGRVAGLNVLGILNEPTAAAVAYSLNYACNESRNVLIFDFGGGTFDVAILSIHNGNIVAKVVDGDTHLGGEDFDGNMVDYCIEQFKKSTGIDLVADRISEDLRLRNDANRRIRRLRNQCEFQKINLSGAPATTVVLDAIHGKLDLAIEISRETFEKINKALLDKSIAIVERALKSSKLPKDSIGDIVLVGGSTRIPKVQELLKNFFGGKALNTSINPDEAVAYGAAIHAAILNGDKAEKLKQISLSDVAPLSIGIELAGGIMSVIIPRNTNIPVKRVKEYMTVADNQKSVNIEIYEGEDATAAENHLLGKFKLSDIPPGKAGSQSIDVTMDIDKNGILNVNAVCKGSGISKNLSIIQDKGRLTPEEIEKLQGKA